MQGFAGKIQVKYALVGVDIGIDTYIRPVASDIRTPGEAVPELVGNRILDFQGSKMTVGDVFMRAMNIDCKTAIALDMCTPVN